MKSLRQHTETALFPSAMDTDINKKIVALGGNPNVGKSTVFNSLTGLKQHTGNWPGKTVTNAIGEYKYNNITFTMIDLPGTYSLMSNSAEEEIARDFLCFSRPDTTVIVADATCLERNLNLLLQTIEITNKVVLCINLIDEAKRKKIIIDAEKLSQLLNIPVVTTNARRNQGHDALMQTIYQVSNNLIAITPTIITYNNNIECIIQHLLADITPLLKDRLNPRWLAIKLIENDSSLLTALRTYLDFDEHENMLLDNLISLAQEYKIKYNTANEDIRDTIVTRLFAVAEELVKQTVTFQNKQYDKFDRKLDKILTSKLFGIPIMLLMLGFIFWLTIVGANYPSEMLSKMFFLLEVELEKLFLWINSPTWLSGILVFGVYRTLSWVISVMLPPMAIFFPLFTILEDLGYLPRVAFNLDNFFKKSYAHGKQALTMCMGFGCNAAAIIGCRIIDSPRERLIAIITNNFVPCNGRFPILISVITMFFAGFFIGPLKSIISTLFLLSLVVIAVLITLLVSKILSKTVLKGLPSSFTLELPPYRLPQIGKVIVRSIFDRTLFVLGRAIIVAIPAGVIIWILANVTVSNQSLLLYCVNFLQPFAKHIGLDGHILMAFILGFPANEIVIPIIIMSYMATGSMLELDSLEQLRQLFINNGWTWITAICVMIFTLMHWPCGTTCLTIQKETKSGKWTILSLLIPTIIGILFCFIFSNIAKLVLYFI